MNNKVVAGLLAGALLLVGGRYYWAQSGSEALPPLRQEFMRGAAG